MARMSHPDLPGRIATIPDDPGTIAVHEQAGWRLEPELTQVNPALAPGEPETPATPEPAPAGQASKRRSRPSDQS